MLEEEPHSLIYNELFYILFFKMVIYLLNAKFTII